MSDYRMQVIHASSGKVVGWKPGADIEVDLINELCDRLTKRGVGLFRTEATVLAAVREEFASLLFDLKRKVR